MEEQNNNEINRNESQRSIYDKWLDSIFQQLETLKKTIFLAREGFGDFQDIMGENRLFHLRTQNFKYCILLFESLLNDLKVQLKEDFFNEQIEGLKDMKKDFTLNYRLFFDSFYNRKAKMNIYYPTPLYYTACNILEDLRGELIQEISSLLYTQTKQQKNKQV